jgi:uncharacterized protein YbcI
MPESDPTLTRAPSAPRGPLQAIADATARHYKEQFGRGPVRCTAHFAGRDAVVIVLDGTMSPAETRLVQDGETEPVRSFRTLQQHGVQGPLRETVEALAGRSIVQAITGIDVASDVATEFFAFEPADPEVRRGA